MSPIPSHGTASPTVTSTGDAASPAPVADDRRSRALASMRLVPAAWRLFSASLFEEVSDSMPELEAWKTEAYRRLVAAPQDYDVVNAALLATPDQSPYLMGLVSVASEVERDNPAFAIIGAAITELLAGGVLHQCTRRLLSAQVALTAHGKAWYTSPAAAPLLERLQAYATGPAHADGAAQCTVDGADEAAAATARAHGGVARATGSMALFNLLRHGRLLGEATADASAPAASTADTAAVPTPDPPPMTQAEIDSAAAALKEEITRIARATPPPATGTAAAPAPRVDITELSLLQDEIRRARPEVRQAVFADAAFMRSLNDLASPFQAAELVRSLDPIESLYTAITNPYAAAPAAASTGDASGGTGHAAPPRYRPTIELLREFFLAHPGADGLAMRMRVLSHSGLSARIGILGDPEREEVMRLAARGSAEITAIDDLQAAVRTRNAAGAARALLRAGGEDRRGVGLLLNDLGFMTGIGEWVFTHPVIVDGAEVIPRDLFYTMCGLSPSAAEDAGSRAVTGEATFTVGPDGIPVMGDRRELQPAEREAVNTLYRDTIATLRGLIHRGWFGGTDDSDLLAALRTFQRAAAAEPILGYLRAAGESAGPELARRYNETASEDLRTALHADVDDDTRRTCEEILGMTLNATGVGTVGGAVVLASDPAVAAHITLDQALRETMAGDVTMDQLFDDAAVALHGELNSYMFNITTVGDVLTIWRPLRDAATPKLGELQNLTGMARVEPIELLANSYRPTGGDLYQALRNAFSDDSDLHTLEEGMPVSEASRRGRADAASAAGAPGAPPLDPFAAPAQALFDQITRLALSTQRGDFEAAATAMATARAPSAPAAAAPMCTPDRPDGVAPPTGTFDQYYREHYGTEPELHLIRVLRTVSYNQEECVAGAGIEPLSRVTGEIESTVAESELTIHEGAPVTPGFTPEEALRIATEIWRILHEGGEIHLITTVLLGSRTAEERRLINAQFRTLSGGLDPVFYLETALSNRHPGGVESSTFNRYSQVGAEGTAAGTAVSDHGDIHIHGDVGALESAADVATAGRIDRSTQLRAAAIQGNVNDLFRIVDALDDAECRQILVDSALLTQIQGACDGVAWDRIERTLTRRDDLTDRLYSRTTGDRASATESIFGGTDETGMTDDIRAYIRRMRLQIQATVDGEESPLRSAEQKAMEVERRLRLACAQLLANPEVEGVLRAELSSTDLSAAEGVLVAHGEDSHEAALAGGGDNAAVLAELRQLTPHERLTHRTDPEYLMELQRRLSDSTAFAEAMNILMSDTPVSAADDHLQRLRSEWDDSEILSTLAQLTEAEMRTLQHDPALMTLILRRLSGDSLASARTILNFDFGAASDIVHIEVAEPDADTSEPNTLPQAEVERLAYLKTRAISELRVAGGQGFQQLMEASVRVFRMDLRPHGWGDPASRAAVRTADATGVPVDDPGTAAETRLRDEVWAEVGDGVRTSQAVTSGAVALNAPQRVESVERAVKKLGDPSGDLLLALTTGLNDDDGIAAMLRNCSDEKLVEDWATVKNHAPGADAAGTLYTKYRAYRSAADAAGTSPTADQSAHLDTLRLDFQRHVLDVSWVFESDLLHEAGGFSEDRAATADGPASLTSARDNHQYTEWVGIIRGRLPGVDKQKIAHAIGADDRPADMAMVQGSTSVALSAAAYRTDDYLHARGTTAGGMGAETEGAELDRYMADYGSHLAEDQVNGPSAEYGTVSEAEGADLATRGAEVDRSLTAFRAARAQSAQIAGLIVATVIAATISVLTLGVATGPCAAMLLAAVTAGAATAGSVAVTESIRGQDYSASDEGMKTIAQSVVTGLITGGTMYWAGQIMAGASGAASGTAATGLAGQAAAVETAAAVVPRTWGTVLATAGREAAEEMIGETMSNSIEGGLAILDPRLWRDGFVEGIDRAGSTARHEINARWSAPLRAGLTSFLTSAIPGALGRGGGDAAEETLRGVDIARNLAHLRDEIPGAAFEAFTSWLTNKALDGGFDISRAPGELFQEFMQEVQEGATYGHVGNVMHGDGGGGPPSSETSGHVASDAHRTGTGTETESSETESESAVVPPVVVPPVSDPIEIRADESESSESESESVPPVDLTAPPVSESETESETESESESDTETDTSTRTSTPPVVAIIHADAGMAEAARRHQVLEYCGGVLGSWEANERVAFLNFLYSPGGMAAMALADGTSAERAAEARTLAEAWHLDWLERVTTPGSTEDAYSMALSPEARAALGDGGLTETEDRPLGDGTAVGPATAFATDSAGRSVSDLLTLWHATPETGMTPETPPSVRREYAIFRTSGGTDEFNAWMSNRSAAIDGQLVAVATSLTPQQIDTIRTTFPRHLSMVPEGGPITAPQLRALFDDFTRAADFSSGGNSMDGFQQWIARVDGGEISPHPEVGLVISPYDLGGFPTFGANADSMNYLATPEEVAHMRPSEYAREIGILKENALWPRARALLSQYVSQFGPAGRLMWVDWVNQNGGFKTLTHASVIFDGPAMRSRVMYLGEHAMHGLSEAVVGQFDSHHPELVNRALVSIPLIAGQPISQSLAAYMRQHLVDEFGLSPTAASQLTMSDLLAIFNPSPMSDLMGEEGAGDIPGETNRGEMVPTESDVSESASASESETSESDTEDPSTHVGHAGNIEETAVDANGATIRSEFRGDHAGAPMSVVDLEAGAAATVAHLASVLRAVGGTAAGTTVTSTTLPNGDVQLAVTLPDGTNRTITIRLAPAATDEVAELRTTDNGAVIVVSPNARPADIERAISHDVAEYLTRQLRPESVGTESELAGRDATDAVPTLDQTDPHDVGRIAELNILLDQFHASPDDAGRSDAERELRVIMVHFGFVWGQVDQRMLGVFGEQTMTLITQAYARTGTLMTGGGSASHDPAIEAAALAANDSNALGGRFVEGSSLRPDPSFTPTAAGTAAVQNAAKAAFAGVATRLGFTLETSTAQTWDASSGGDRMDTFIVRGPTGAAFTVRLDTTPLPGGVASRGMFNPTKEAAVTATGAAAPTAVVGRHVIQLSDQLPESEIERALVDELAILAARRELSAAGMSSTPSMLAPNVTPPPDAVLSPSDRGLIAQFDLLADQHGTATTPEARAHARREIIALVEAMGLRAPAPGADERALLARNSLGSDAARTLLADLRAGTLTDPADVAARDAVATQVAFDDAAEQRRESFATGNQMPTAGDRAGDPAALAREAYERRAAMSRITLAYYRAAASSGTMPVVHSPMVGAGASLSARDPNQLLIDARGRWQADASDRLAQTQTQLQSVSDSGLGVPGEFTTSPTGRVPMQGIQFWQDDLAAQGPVIDGECRIEIDSTGKMIAVINPSDGSGEIRLEIAGTPTIASGFPIENVPGLPRNGPNTLPLAIRNLRAALDTIAADATHPAHAQAVAARTSIAAFDGTDLAQADAIRHLFDNAILNGAVTAAGGAESAQSLSVLGIVADWSAMRTRDAARADGQHVFLADEANTADTINRTIGPGADPANFGKTWVIAGTGGTGLSAAEIILRLDPTAFVTMVGADEPAGLMENDQYREVMRLHGGGTPPHFRVQGGTYLGTARDGASGGVEIDSMARTAPRGTPPVAVEGDFLVSGLGRAPGFPRAIASAVETALRDNPSSVTVELMLDSDRQYCGYRINIGSNAFEITGAASRYVPVDMLNPADRARLQVLLNQSSDGDAPSESGNFDGGFGSSAAQAERYARRRREMGY